MISRNDSKRVSVRQTIAQRLIFVDEHPTGFDYLRLILAVSVIAMHSVIICYGQSVEIEFWQSGARPFIRMILPMFFALSGFLVAGSLLRSRTILMFVGLRAIRIFPALFVEVTLSALILGPIFTTLGLWDYLSHPQFHAYFWNIVGDVHFKLPGVFESNRNPGYVNGQLWTVPYELYCYLILATVAVAGAIRSRWIVPMGAVLLTMAYAIYKYFQTGSVPAQVTGPLVGVLLVVCFLVGVAIYLYREELRLDNVLGLTALFSSVGLIAFIPYGDFIAPWPIAYATVYIGLLNPSKTFVINGADYSYGLFLYGYPIQQALAATGPWAQSYYANVIAAVAVGTVFAFFSWRIVERPALSLRRPFRKIEEMWLARKSDGGNRQKGKAVTPVE
jgi:peptidoglycan/LPS O-acetylase OafA/YrhL